MEGMIKPGDVIIEKIELESYTGFKMSLKGLFENFVIYEDIYSNCMTGSITIIDSVNMVRHFPIIGSETLTVTYYTPSGSGERVNLKFRTFKISMYMETAQPTTMLVRLEFASPHTIKNTQTKISKSYSNMTVSKMVEKIYDEYLASDVSGEVMRIAAKMPIYGTLLGKSAWGNASSVGKKIGDVAGTSSLMSGMNKVPIRTVQETLDARTYTIPYWSPLKAINWLSKRARASSNPTYCDYVFFQNSDGHHFVPLSLLKQAPPTYTYTNYPPGLRSESGSRMLEYEMRNVMSMSIQDYTDKIEQQEDGVFASSLMTHDLTTKSFNTTRFDYDREFSSVGSHVERNRIIPVGKTDYTDAFLSNTKYYSGSTYVVGGKEKNFDPDAIILYRQSLINQMNAVNLILECHGDSNVKVGQIINFETIAKESGKKTDKFDDDYLKGKYMITAIRHEITDRKHRMTMTISKDSFAEPIADFKNPVLG